MKIKTTLTSYALIVLCVLLIQPYSSSAAGITPAVTANDGGKRGAKKAITYSSRNNHSVRIYPDALKRVMHVIAKGNDGKEIDFFVFDLEGTLIQHYKMGAGDHEKLVNLERKKYVYQVFSGDEESAIGQFEMR
ncbi:MAG TPA: hypothetical protein VK644_07835 [Chitinophagaceae bacterium]|nr:hypothetical protein [Chitinophagaceae bacterium]